jgi:hypothetical protein
LKHFPTEIHNPCKRATLRRRTNLYSYFNFLIEGTVAGRRNRVTKSLNSRFREPTRHQKISRAARDSVSKMPIRYLRIGVRGATD